MVISIEGLNTAVEKIADFIHHPNFMKNWFIKDIAAGAVNFLHIGSTCTSLIIYIPFLSR
jgi:diacylglycerol kinase (ATP)